MASGSGGIAGIRKRGYRVNECYTTDLKTIVVF
jgi:hypothetical protein